MSKLEQNTISLDEVLAMVNALPDAGGGGSATWTIGTFTVTDNGMYEPGVNEYVLESNDLRLSERTCVIVEDLSDSYKTYVPISFIRNSTSDSFDVRPGTQFASVSLGTDFTYLEENSITVVGEISSGAVVGFRAI